VSGPSGLGLDLHSAAARLGGYRWLEHRLFELTGAWSARSADPEVQLHLFEASHRHGWHAQLWADRLPVLDQVDAELLTVAPGFGAEALLDQLASVDAEPETSPGGTEVRRLAALYRVVVPRLIATYSAHRALANPATDGPTIRALTLVLRDETETGQAGESLLEARIDRGELADLAAATQRGLERSIVDAAPGLGIAPWPDRPTRA
jgi:hypothetical protein